MSVVSMREEVSDVPIFVQLVSTESFSLLRRKPLVFPLLPVSMKQSLIAISTFVPGYSTLFSNFICRIESNEHLSKANIASGSSKNNGLLARDCAEYHSLYIVETPAALWKKSFAEAFMILWSSCECLLVGVDRATKSRDSGSFFLPPGSFPLKALDKLAVLCGSQDCLVLVDQLTEEEVDNLEYPQIEEHAGDTTFTRAMSMATMASLMQDDEEIDMLSNLPEFRGHLLLCFCSSKLQLHTFVRALCNPNERTPTLVLDVVVLTNVPELLESMNSEEWPHGLHIIRGDPCKNSDLLGCFPQFSARIILLHKASSNEFPDFDVLLTMDILRRNQCADKVLADLLDLSSIDILPLAGPGDALDRENPSSVRDMASLYFQAGQIYDNSLGVRSMVQMFHDALLVGALRFFLAVADGSVLSLPSERKTVPISRRAVPQALLGRSFQDVLHFFVCREHVVLGIARSSLSDQHIKVVSQPTKQMTMEEGDEVFLLRMGLEHMWNQEWE